MNPHPLLLMIYRLPPSRATVAVLRKEISASAETTRATLLQLTETALLVHHEGHYTLTRKGLQIVLNYLGKTTP